MRIRLSILFALTLSLLASRPASAQSCARLSWGESRTAAFVFTYQESAPLGAEIAAQFGETLDEAFFRFARLFETSLPVPVMVRVYPDEREYYCFNALAPRIPLGSTHSHVGGREIALIAKNITADPESWQAEGLNALRHELAILYFNFLSSDQSPPGLQVGIGNYAQDPFTTFESRFKAAPPPLEAPSATWRVLWESPDIITFPENELQAASITAYLIDVYGWDRFLLFAESLRTAESWRLALEEVYPAGAGALETQWATSYYPLYMQGRWRQNVLYGLSLRPYEQLVAAGAYQAAADGLAEVISLLLNLEDFERLSQAQTLNARAQRGLEADALARQARQAYLEGDFEDARDFAQQALERYLDLNDIRNRDHLLATRSQANEVIELHGELAGLQTKIGALSSLLQGPRLIEIGLRLQELGDEDGARLAADLLKKLNARKQVGSAMVAGAGALMAAALLFHRLRAARSAPPPEAQLQL